MRGRRRMTLGCRLECGRGNHHRAVEHHPWFQCHRQWAARRQRRFAGDRKFRCVALEPRSEEHTSELQSLMRISYAVFCLKKKKKTKLLNKQTTQQQMETTKQH